MITNNFGELAAVLTALCWAITSISFEDAVKKIGPVNLNLMRLVIALVFLSMFSSVTRGELFPVDASSDVWIWLSLSGIVGIVVGDQLILEAISSVGARTTMLIYSSVPPLSGFFAFIILKETMTSIQIIGMMITIWGIVYVITDRYNATTQSTHKQSTRGIIFAVGGSICQSLGYVIGKYGMVDYNPFAATQIRLLAGVILLCIMFTFGGQWRSFITVLGNGSGLKSTIVGSFFGPFIGISLSLYAVQRINPGVASTLMSITPVLLVIYAVMIKKEHVHIKEVAGTIIVVCGLGVMFI